MRDEPTKKTIRSVRTKKGIKKYTYPGCPLTRNRSAWCYRMCPPDAEGHGRCGRIAPHSLKSSTQMAILNYKKRKLKEHVTRLVNLYLSGYSNSPSPGALGKGPKTRRRSTPQRGRSKM